MLKYHFTRRITATLAVCMSAFVAGYAGSAASAAPVWADPAQLPQTRVAALMKAMTPAEKLALVSSHFGYDFKDQKRPAGSLRSAGYVAANERLGIPALQITDAGLGVTKLLNILPGDGATSLPSSLALSGAFDDGLAHEGGVMIATEARHRGFNVILAGGMNLTRDPRNGRNFEYLGEDPLLAGRIAAATIQGVQSQHIISTVKHYALNAYETGRMQSSSDINLSAMHESDLLAFKIAIEQGKPGSVMCSYNRVNGDYACESQYLLTEVLRNQWQYPGFVMSDWGGISDGPKAALAGVDQDSAATLDERAGFVDYMRKNMSNAKGVHLLDEKVQHILYAMIANGLFDHHEQPSETEEDIAAHMAVARHVEEKGAVLLQNTNKTLPLLSGIKTLLVVGGHADKGVISGGGSGAVQPRGGSAVIDPVDGGPLNMPHPIIYEPNAPVEALRRLLPETHIIYDDGSDLEKTTQRAKEAQAVIVFAIKWQGESLDAANLEMDPAINRLIDTVADANHHVTVVLETGNPVTLPWSHKVGAILEAWYPGSAGGEAIANLLTGKVNPSGRTTMTWPHSLADLPRPEIPGAGEHTGMSRDDISPVRFLKNYDFNIEGADVGYRWFAAKGKTVAYPFGYGLSYTNFAHNSVSVTQEGPNLVAHVTIRNTGHFEGDDIVQIYAVPPGETTPRLAGYQRVSLAPGEQKQVTVTLSPYATLRYDVSSKSWKHISGQYHFSLRQNAADQTGPTTTIQLPG